MALVTVKLLGDLAKYNLSHQLNVISVREALDAIATQKPDFRKHIVDQSLEGAQYRIIINGERYISEHQLTDPVGNATITIVPAITGSGNIGKIIGGLAMVGFGIFSGGIGFLGISATSMILVGGTLALSGLVGLFNKPKTADDDKKKENFIFNGAVNNSSGYGRVPILIGAGYKGTGFIVGSLVVSASIRSYSVVA